MHVQRRCHSSYAHPPVSLPEGPVTITTPEPYCLFLILNSVPVTLVYIYMYVTGEFSQDQNQFLAQ